MGFLEGLRIRKAAAQVEIDRIADEEAGARDALSLAYEEQKKYEQVADDIASPPSRSPSWSPRPRRTGPAPGRRRPASPGLHAGPARPVAFTLSTLRKSPKVERNRAAT